MRPTLRLFAITIAILAGSVAARAQAPVTPTTHRGIISWTYVQSPTAAVASQFDVYRTNKSGGCVQIAAVPPSTTATFPAGCTQVGSVPVVPGSTSTAFSYTDQANGTTNILTEGQLYCWVIVSQSSTGNFSDNGSTQAGAKEVCNTIPFAGAPPAPTGEALSVQ